MSQASLSLLVLKTQQLSTLRAFYGEIGIEFAEEQHGSGPRHFAGRAGPVLIEIYPLPEGAVADTTLRLGFAVPVLDNLIERLRSGGVRIMREPEPTPYGKRAVVKDPDGRSVELTLEERNSSR